MGEILDRWQIYHGKRHETFQEKHPRASRQDCGKEVSLLKVGAADQAVQVLICWARFPDPNFFSSWRKTVPPALQLGILSDKGAFGAVKMELPRTPTGRNSSCALGLEPFRKSKTSLEVLSGQARKGTL